MSREWKLYKRLRNSYPHLSSENFKKLEELEVKFEKGEIQVDCIKCGKEVKAPALTGEHCTLCYFDLRNKGKGKNSHESTNGSTTAGITESPATVIGSVSEPNQISEGYQADSGTNNQVPEGRQEVSGGNNSDNGEAHPSAESDNPEPKHRPSKSANALDNSVKYCQSCLERGYGSTLATREDPVGYFLCDDCHQHILANLTSVADDVIYSAESIDAEKPLLSKFYDIFDVPEEYRHFKSDEMLRSRDDIFNHNSKALVNLDTKQVKSQIEELRIMLFYIRTVVDQKENYVNRVKEEERAKSGVTGIKKSLTEAKKKPGEVKVSQEQAQADLLFRNKFPFPHSLKCACSDCQGAANSRLMAFKRIAEKGRLQVKIQEFEAKGIPVPVEILKAFQELSE